MSTLKDVSWSTSSAYIKYKNSCLGTTCDNVSTKNNVTNSSVNVNNCIWSNYGDYLKYKNIRQFTKNPENTHLG